MLSKRRAQAVLNDSSIDPQSRAMICYALETNDPWLARLVRQADTEGTIDLSEIPLGSDADSTEDKIKVLTDKICRGGDSLSDLDPLVKLAIIHHQFESIHPFYDGNGRTGRIINILYLVIKDLLDLPILYLSGYIIENKAEYYRLLQTVRDTNDWESWIVFILRGVEQTASETIFLVEQIRSMMTKFKQGLRKDLPKLYSQDLLNNLFRHPYTKIEFVEDELRVSRKTASQYLKQLVENGYLKLLKIGRSNFYLNEPLFNLFVGARHGFEGKKEVTID
jgi:Fic family protein